MIVRERARESVTTKTRALRRSLFARGKSGTVINRQNLRGNLSFCCTRHIPRSFGTHLWPDAKRMQKGIVKPSNRKILLYSTFSTQSHFFLFLAKGRGRKINTSAHIAGPKHVFYSCEIMNIYILCLITRKFRSMRELSAVTQEAFSSGRCSLSLSTQPSLSPLTLDINNVDFVPDNTRAYRSPRCWRVDYRPLSGF